MTRFPELSRIQAAIKHKNQSELQWALGYCKKRLSIASHKHHLKTWNDRIREIEAALEELDQNSNWDTTGS
jgi:hypothetical protein